ncbi:MAG: DUF5362 family protein [Opitutales bacterium]
MSLYTMRGADGREYGPVSEDQLNQWIQEGRANAQTEIKRDQGAFQRMGTLSEFAPALGKDERATAAPVQATPRVGNYLPSRGSTSAATIRDAAAPLARATFWMKFLAFLGLVPVMMSVVGVLVAVAVPALQGSEQLEAASVVVVVIGAVIGLAVSLLVLSPYILMWIKLWKAAGAIKMAALNGDALSMTEACARLRWFFTIGGVLFMLYVLFVAAAYFYVLVIAPGNF